MKLKLSHQISLVLASVGLCSGICYLFESYLGYHAVALILLVLTSLIATSFDIVPVVLAATLSALTWNFFFIPPRFTFHISYSEDLLLFLLYFFIALVNGLLTVKIREAEAKARDKEEKEVTISLYNTLLNSLSHELRTPIATIIGAVDTLKDAEMSLNEDQKVSLFQGIESASLRLNQQVENLLNMSRLESGELKLSMDWVDIESWIFSVKNKFLGKCAEVEIQIHLEEGLPLFQLDVGLMDQLMDNLLTNAVQYGTSHPVIRIEVGIKKEQLEILLSDNGPGFPEEHIPSVFDKFYRLPASKAGGTGLGLSIVKGFIAAHQGSIELNNLPKGGCQFSVLIPAPTSYINLLKHE
jgi:two-component system sensor histidine kinase KdpD